MGNKYNKQANSNNIYVSIFLQQYCYFPSEIINGKITLRLKNTDSQPNFEYPIINIFFSEETSLLTQIENFDNFYNSCIEKRQIISQTTLGYPDLKKKYISFPLNLTISFKIPENIYPTFIVDNGLNYIKHFLIIRIPCFNLSKKILIIIKNKKRYTKANNLYKEQLYKFFEKSNSLIKNSKIYCLIKTDKNSYAYNEIIPYKITINCSDSKLYVKFFRFSLIHKIIHGNFNEVKIEKIITKDYDINEENNLNNSDRIYKFSDFLNFKGNNPIKIYNYYNKILLENLNEEIHPTCISDALTCCYFLYIEIFYNKFILSDDFELPIDMYSPGKEEDNNTNIKKIEINEETPGEICAEDFEILNHEDFSKILCDEIEKDFE